MDRIRAAFLQWPADRRAFLLLLSAVVFAYGNVFLGVYQFDDYKVIVDYRTVHSLSAWWADVGHGLRPLLKLSYTLNWISGTDPAGFHLVNLGLHAAATLLVYRLAGLVMEGRKDGAFVVALLFAVHPAASEAVTYVSGRSMSLMTVFYLAAMLVYIRGVRENRRLWLHGLSPLLFLLAVASKETALLLPFSLLLWERCFNRSLGWLAVLKRQGIHWAFFFTLVVAMLANTRHWEMMMVSAELGSVQTNLLTQLHAMSYLLGQLLWPWRMNIDPDPTLVASWSQGVPDLALWLGLLVIAAYNWRKRPWLCFAIAWFVLLLLPVYVFLPRIDVVNDRHLYLAGWPMLLPLAGLLGQLRAVPRLGLTAVLALALGASSMMRNLDYRSEIALWESTVKLSPQKSRVHNNLGYAYFLAGRDAEAERAYLTAIELDPDNWRARGNLARLRER